MTVSKAIKLVLIHWSRSIIYEKNKIQYNQITTVLTILNFVVIQNLKKNFQICKPVIPTREVFNMDKKTVNINYRKE